MNYTKVQLNLHVTPEFLEESDVSEDELPELERRNARDDRDWGEGVDSEHDAAVALKRMRSMPTWRAVRGKGAGKGEAKLEWGTRLIIYSLLGMMVPPAAVGISVKLQDL